MVARHFDPATITSAIANRVLERETWARERLSAHAGRVFVIAIGPLAAALAVDPSGMVESSPLSHGAPDLTLRLSPLDLPAFLADPRRWDRFVGSEGDPALAATLKDLAQTLPWFVEQAFAKALRTDRRPAGRRRRARVAGLPGVRSRADRRRGGELRARRSRPRGARRRGAHLRRAGCGARDARRRARPAPCRRRGARHARARALTVPLARDRGPACAGSPT